MSVTAPPRRTNDNLRRLLLPYGLWVCDSGREVLFNRLYKPIWHRASGSEKWKPADRREWVSGNTSEIYFYNDATSPQDKLKIGREALHSRGIPVPTLDMLKHEADENR